MKIRFQIYFLLTVVMLFLCSCDKESGPIQQENPPGVSTAPITDITATSASGGGKVFAEGSFPVTARGVCWNSSKKPTILDSKTVNDSGMGSFTSSISGLNTGVMYYVRAYATNKAGTSYGNEMSFNSGSCPGIPTVTYSGKTYNTIQIGYQCWLRENLDVGTMMNGTRPSNNNKIEKYCYENKEKNCNMYGGLYTWQEAMQYSTIAGAQGICPTGWHIPTLAEYIKLAETVNGNGKALIAAGQGEATNSSGFSALFSGYYTSSLINDFSRLGDLTYLWSSTIYDRDNAVCLPLTSRGGSIRINKILFKEGASVRCIKN
jgi:uncharacterized protein (TIGR02145 family)